jgi:CopG family transcriptional regulator/antitoxin EndoAI
VKAAERRAKQEHRTKSELVREALRRYIAEQEWKTLQAFGERKAADLGIRSAEDVDRLVHEHRKTRRR